MQSVFGTQATSTGSGLTTNLGSGEIAKGPTQAGSAGPHAVGVSEISVVSHYDGLDIFRDTQTYTLGGGKTIYEHDAYVLWNRNGTVKEIKSLIHITNYQASIQPDKPQWEKINEAWRVTSGFGGLTHNLQEFVQGVEQYKMGGFIGDPRHVLIKYLEFSLSPTDKPQQNMNATTGPHR